MVYVSFKFICFALKGQKEFLQGNALTDGRVGHKLILPRGIERRAVFKEITRVRQIEKTVWKAAWPMATTAQGNLK